MAPLAEHRTGLPLWHPASLIAYWFGAGLIRVAPGTWGSLAALPCAWLIAEGFGQLGLLIAAALLFPAGCWAAGRVGHASGVADDGAIVVDEVVGQWLTLTVAPLNPLAYLIGFLLFRLFDIAKPWPVGWADRRLHGGFGVMADDVLAGVYAALALFIFLDAGALLIGR